MEKRLFRNEHDKVVAGVSSGIAEYMEVDVTIIRLLFVLSTIFLVGTGILVYIVMWIVVPVNNDPAAKFSKFNDFFKDQNNPFQSAKPSGSQKSSTESAKPYQDWTSWTVKDEGFDSSKQAGDFKPYQKNNETGRTVAGLFLLVIGMYFLMNEFGMIPFWFQLTKLWPLVFVAIGASFIIKSKNKNAWESWKEQNYQTPGSPGSNPVNSTVSTDAPSTASTEAPSTASTEAPSTVSTEAPVTPEKTVDPDAADDKRSDDDTEEWYMKKDI